MFPYNPYQDIISRLEEREQLERKLLPWMSAQRRKLYFTKLNSNASLDESLALLYTFSSVLRRRVFLFSTTGLLLIVLLLYSQGLLLTYDSSRRQELLRTVAALEEQSGCLRLAGDTAGYNKLRDRHSHHVEMYNTFNKKPLANEPAKLRRLEVFRPQVAHSYMQPVWRDCLTNRWIRY